MWSGGEWGQLQLNGLLDVDGSNRPFQSTAVQPAVKKSLPNGNASTIKEFQAKPNQTKPIIIVNCMADLVALQLLNAGCT